MSLAGWLAELQRRDVHLWAEGDRLRCSAPSGLLTADLREALQERKHEILQFLRTASLDARLPPGIVGLQTGGTRTPIFAVPGHNGEVLCYRTLADQLGADQPFFGLEPPGVDGRGAPMGRVEDLACWFADRIQETRPGPYVIAGFCAGGTIAFELARQLQARGAASLVLALFASPYPCTFRFPLARRVGARARALARLPSAQSRWTYLASWLQDRRARSAGTEPSAPADLLLRRRRVERASLAAVRRYSPGPFAGRVVMFLPNREWLASGFEPRRWREVALDVQEFFGSRECSVDDMLRGPATPGIAAAVRAVCDEARAGHPARPAIAREQSGHRRGLLTVATPQIYPADSK